MDENKKSPQVAGTTSEESSLVQIVVELVKRVEKLEKEVAAGTTTKKTNIELDGKKIAESIILAGGR